MRFRKIASLCCTAAWALTIVGATPRPAAAARLRVNFVAVFVSGCYMDFYSAPFDQGSDREEEIAAGSSFAAYFPGCAGAFVDARPLDAVHRQGGSACQIDGSCFL